ncbi:MAG: hypothetical protein KKE02_24945 [Alphaproteobacteria bacterium]|jgi:N-methylhydantoinase A/oxoprolinase/acetone carboxylase beta subunit|uniref:Uncharacterized protein n=1 Tax=viral metagenome TaxID=1070528 RepID=A0A6M3K0Y6_9ZZZZ|nr:hypothetical protein [Brevundimonas sp.]MBU2154289.1 hypothetical protein [Alphaproteobacteria bacterium]MDZ4112808.1 hypothetical protein [Brevundimonas sp.]
MNFDQMQSFRDLVDFAHARNVFEEAEDRGHGAINGDAILDAANIALTYLDGDQNEVEDEALPA